MLAFGGCSGGDGEDSSLQERDFALEPAFAGAVVEFPTDLDRIPNEPGRYLVLEKRGLVLLLDEKRATAEVVGDLSDRVSSAELEQGLFSLAFPPDYREGGRVFLYYTQGGPDVVEVPHRAVLSSLTFKDGQLDESSEHEILSIERTGGPARHYGGGLAFGPDGYLYLGLGDGGGREDRFGRAQDLGNLEGSIVRLAVSATGYTVPPDNPFVDDPDEALPEIYAYGLRNPYRLTFDSETGDLWVADTGQDRWEEVNLVESGGNYGWNVREGFECIADEGCNAGDFLDPIAVYNQEQGDCAIIGGRVYRGTEFPALNGYFIYSDFCSGRIWAVAESGDAQTLIADQQEASYSVVADEDGEILVLGEAGILRLVSR